MEEIWKDIKGYEGAYQVSNFGQVRSLDRTINHPNGPTKRRGIILKQVKTGERRNYHCVDLKSVQYKVHRLVATAFIPNPENKPEVNHIDGNPSNNHVENLEWVTASENQVHALATGLLVRERGVSCANTKYSLNVFKNGEFITCLTGTAAMIAFGLQPSKVLCCIKGSRKTHKGYTYEKVPL